MVVAPLGGGFGMELPVHGCQGAFDTANEIMDFALHHTELLGAKLHEKGAGDDCGLEGIKAARMFCDLHCIRDAVKSGDKAIQGSLYNAVDVMGRNMDMVMEYYIGTVHDELAVMKENQEEIKKGQSLMEVQGAKTKLFTMFDSMKGMLGSRLHAAGHATAARALDSFVVRFSRGEHMGVTNASQKLNDLTSEVDHLMNTISVASTNQLSISSEVARRTATGLHDMSDFLSSHNDMIGVYRTAAEQTKQKQEALSVAAAVTELSEEVEVAEAKTILRDADRSWWRIREKIDLYWEAAAKQAAAFGDALTVLDRYTLKCASDLTDLNNVETRAMKADEEARNQLHHTWHSVVHEIGLLTAMIVDSDGFLQLGRLDAFSVKVSGNRSTICGSGRSANKAVLSEVEGALQAGLAYQTWKQLTWIVAEMTILRERFASDGLQMPGYETLTQAMQRVSKSFKELAGQQGDLAVGVAARLCDRKESLLQTSPQDSMDMKGMFKEIQAQHVAERAADRAADDKLKAQHVVERAADDKKFDAERAERTADDKKVDSLLIVVVVLLCALVTLGWVMWRK